MKENIIDVFIGESIKNERVKLGYSLNDAASRMKMSKQTYYHYEQGTRTMRYTTLMRICAFYDIDLKELLGNAQDMYFEYLRNGGNDGNWED